MTYLRIAQDGAWEGLGFDPYRRIIAQHVFEALRHWLPTRTLKPETEEVDAEVDADDGELDDAADDVGQLRDAVNNRQPVATQRRLSITQERQWAAEVRRHSCCQTGAGSRSRYCLM